jgi:prophage antirepressor-like protein
MVKLTVFENNESGKFGTTFIDGEVFFKFDDVCSILEISNKQQLKSRLSKSGIKSISLGENGQQIDVFISESNLYRCVMQSKKPEAERFQDWVVEEVLPSIRKHGAYVTGDKLMEILNDPRKMAEILINLADERELRIKAQKELEVAKPKLDHYDRILDSKSLQTVTTLSRSFGMTAQILNKILLKLRVIRRLSNSGSVYGFTAKYEGKDYGNVKDLPIYRKDGEISFYQKTLVYSEKGREMISNLFLDLGFIQTNPYGTVIPDKKKINEFIKEKEEDTNTI